jgi:amino acid transporter
MSEVLWGRIGKIIVNLSIAIYLYGALCIKCVSAANALNTGFAFIIKGSTKGFDDLAFNPYYIFCIVFFAIVTFMSFRSVQNTKVM